MYKLVGATLRRYGLNEGFVAVNISAMRLADLFSTYRDGFVSFSHVSLSRPVHLQLDEMRDGRFVPTHLTVSAWLSANGDKTIVGTNVTPTMVDKSIRFSDAIQAGHSFNMMHPNDPRPESVYPKHELTSAWLFKSERVTNLMHRRSLITVNGLLHYSYKMNDRIHVEGAGRSIQVANDHHFGIISFEDHSDVDQYRIDPKWIFPDINSFSRSVYIKTGKNLAKKSILLSFMGVLLDDRYFSFDDAGNIKIYIEKIDITQLYMDQRNLIDLSTLKVTERLYLTGAIDVADFLDEALIDSILQLPQTFIIVVDSPVVCLETTLVQSVGLMHEYEFVGKAMLPLVNDLGHMHSYWKLPIDNGYRPTKRFYVAHGHYLYPYYQHTAEEDREWVMDTPEIKNVIYCKAYMLNIRSHYPDYMK